MGRYYAFGLVNCKFLMAPKLIQDFTEGSDNSRGGIGPAGFEPTTS